MKIHVNGFGPAAPLQCPTCKSSAFEIGVYFNRYSLPNGHTLEEGALSIWLDCQRCDYLGELYGPQNEEESG